MHAKEVSEFLNHLAIDLSCAAGTQRIALNALVCLYTKFLKRDLGVLDFKYASVPKRRPIVLTHTEALKVIDFTSGDYQLIMRLLYGTGLRRAECLSLRVKDIDFARSRIMVHQGKGNKDRSTLLPDQLIDLLHDKIERVEKLHHYDIDNGFGSVYLPNGLSRKYKNAEFEFIWQFLFPSASISKDPRSDIRRRHHLHPSQVQKHLRKAVLKSGIRKRITCHTFRHSFATELAKAGVHLTQIQRLMGHSDIATTEVYLHIAEEMGLSVTSPIDQ